MKVLSFIKIAADRIRTVSIKNSVVISVCLLFWISTQAQTSTIDSLFQEIKYTNGVKKAKSYNSAANFYKLNKPDTAIILARQSLTYADELNTSEAFGIIAECYNYMAQFDSSASYYLKAIKISEKLNNRKKASSFYVGMGNVLYQLGDFEKSVFYMQMASRMRLKDGDTIYYAAINGNVAAIFQRLGRFKEAIALLKDSEIKLRHSGKQGLLANLYNSLGSAYQLESKNLDSAAYYYQKNIDMITKPEDEAYRLAAYVNIAGIYIEKNQFDKADINLQKALGLSTFLKRTTERTSIYENFSLLYEKKKDYAKSLYYKNMQYGLKDSIYNTEREKLVHDLESQSQIEKRDLTIKTQELFIEKEKSKTNKILFISIIAGLFLIATALYFWIKKRSKEALEKAKSKIFQNIAHEIRTPLTLIVGPLAMLRSEYENDNNRSQFYMILENSKKLVALIEELLLAANLEKETYTIKYVMGDIVLFSESLVYNFNTLARKAEVRIKFDSNAPECNISFAANAYEKIVNNLVSNAIKYNKPDGVVEVELEASNSLIILTVKDTGIGLNKEEKKKIFERFYRSESKKDQSGFGIGLAIVKELVDLQKGEINVESEPGLGTKVTVQLPVLDHNTITSSNINTIEKHTEDDVVLVVEDSDDIYAFIEDILQKCNLKVVRASNGHEGFKKATELLPTIIITDVMMPLEDGISMTKRIKTNELSCHIPVIILSAKGSEESRVEGLHSGADFYLRKPFNPDELILVITNTVKTLKNQWDKFQNNLIVPEKSFKERVAGNDLYLQKIVDAVDANIMKSDFSVNELADIMCISRSQLHRKLAALTNISTTNFIRLIKLEKAKDLLQVNAGNVSEIAYQCGFNSQSYFSSSFAEHFGKTPSEFLK